MYSVRRILLIALLAASLNACGKTGENSADHSTVLATVNGTPITNDMMRAFIREHTGGQEPQLSDEQRKNVLNTVIDMEVLAQEAQKNGLSSKPDTVADLLVAHDNLLAQQLVRGYMDQHQVSDDQVKAAYAEYIKGMDNRQFKARHILVQSEAQAKDIIAQLGKGANFAQLAKKYSTDTGSAANGGELGDWFSPQAMVPEFSSALASLKKGEYTHQPVHSQYGWHVIQLEDVRDQPPPALEQMRDQLMKELQSKTAEAYINNLRGTAKIEMTPATGGEAVSKLPTAATTKP